MPGHASIELIPAIRAMLRELDGASTTAERSGRRAALWRAQQRAARLDGTLEDVRRYCLDVLTPERLLVEDDYLRGFREGLEEVLLAISALESDGSP
jgi:hypothetical protein